MLKFDDHTGNPLPKTEKEIRSSLHFLGWFAEEVEARVDAEMDCTCDAEIIGPVGDSQSLGTSMPVTGPIRIIGWKSETLVAALVAIGISIAAQ
ncbi:hypothetical protein PZN02_005287 [Sinorhizobium garamanticum]|uniref:Uncharacterized protein n=1 Tax=Sinorhizobium garamanticum TaxID=680247 RepID=A0ABY8DK94_9HYPH|nr:hypothetical protein [Sinorhizobium garamanticum]WEX89950.1 hypothetical protein PZN02_005287 [Sinorhizobium garamanticum]